MSPPKKKNAVTNVLGAGDEEIKGPASWAEVAERLLSIEAEHGLIGRVVIPFEGPEAYHRPAFGCPVVRGERFTVICCNGTVISG